MATARTIAEILALAADNTSGQINPLDLRDIIVTLEVSFGELFIAQGDEAPTTITNTTDSFPVAGTWTFGEATPDFDEPANGQLRYVGLPNIACLIFGQVSITSAGNNDTVELRAEVNGFNLVGSRSRHFLGTGLDVAALMVFGVVPLSTNDLLTLAVRNVTATNDLTAEEAHLMAVGIAA